MNNHFFTILIILLTSCVRTELHENSSKAVVPTSNGKTFQAGQAAVVPPVVRNLKEMPFPFGAAINDRLVREQPNYKAVLIREFTSLTAEGSMKFIMLHPGPNAYNFTRADNVVNFAQANGMRVHGHTLIWHDDLPKWVLNFTGNADDWEDLFKTHIQSVVAHFKGKVVSWDVVNELFEMDGSYRKTIWQRNLRPGYVARAFCYANQIDPNALLFYNDFGQEKSVQKRTAIYNLVMSLKRSGVPIHGIGLQMHTSITQANEGITAAINNAASTGLKVHLSELDVSLNPNRNSGVFYSNNIANQQKEKYKAIIKAYMTISKAQQFGITTWNVGDADSWIPVRYGKPDWPLPFDINYKPKPAYYGILEGASSVR